MLSRSVSLANRSVSLANRSPDLVGPRIYPRFLSTTVSTDPKKTTLSSDPPNKKEQEGLYLRSKRFLKAYGLVGVATYWGLWSGVFGGFYFSFKTGMMDYESWKWLHMDVLEGYYIKSLTWVGIDPDDHPVTPETKDILVAMAAAKVLKLIEFLAAVAITPPLARTLSLAPPVQQKIKDLPILFQKLIEDSCL